MKLNLQLIARHINAHRTRLIERDSSRTTLKNVYLFNRNEPCTDGCAYLLTSAELRYLKKQDASRGFTYIVLYTPDEEYKDLPNGWDVLHISASWDRNVVFHEIQQIFELYQNWENELKDAVLMDAGVEELMEIATKLFPNPIALFDASFSLIGYGGKLPEVIHDPIWETVAGKGYGLAKNLPDDFRLYYSLMRSPERLLCYPDFTHSTKNGGNRILMAHLMRKEQIYAVLAMNELCRPYEQCDLAILDEIRIILERSGQILHYSGYGSDNESVEFQDLLEGHKLTPVQMEHMMQTQGWSSYKNYLIIRIISAEPSVNITELNAVQFIRRIRKTEPAARIYYQKGAIIILKPYRPHHEKKEISDAFITVLESASLAAGVSLPFSDFAHIYEAHQQARTALEFAADKCIIYFSDIAFRKLKHSISVDGRYDYYMHPLVLKLRDSGKIDLLDTLYHYLETGCQLSETARILSIHRNTVSYRLDTLEDLCGLRIHELTPDELWLLRLSCRLVRE